MLTHRNLVFVTASVAEYLEMRAEEGFLRFMPLSFAKSANRNIDKLALAGQAP